MQKLIRQLVSVICFLSVTVGSVFCQQYNFQNLNVEDGLAQSQVYSIAQDQQGSLWMGTRGGGINLYNGIEFKTLTTKNGLLSNYINKIVVDKKGIIWIASSHGLEYFDGTRFLTIAFEPKTIMNVNDVFVTPENTLICATANGIFEIKKFVSKKVGSKVKAMNEAFSTAIKDQKGTYWFGSNTGFYSFSNSTGFKSYKDQNKVMGNSITIVRQDQTGKLNIGTYGDGMYVFDHKKFYRIDYHHELYRQTILDVFIDATNDVWLATLNSGVIQYSNKSKTFTSITESKGLSNNHVRCVFQDNSNAFWFGTSGGGVSHYFGKQFTHYDERSGLGGNFIYSVFKDHANNLWIGNSQQGVTLMKQNEVIRYDATSGFQNTKVKAISEDKLGNIYLGTDGSGVYLFKNGNFEEIQDLAKAYVKDMKADANGNVWIATAGSGLIKVEATSSNLILTKWTVAEGLLSNRITSLHVDKKNRVWYGSESHGVGCMDQDKLLKAKLSTKNGLISPLIRCLTEDDFGRLWIGTAGGGVHSFPIYTSSNSPKVQAYGEENGLSSGNIYSLICDDNGKIIVGTEQGIDHISFNENGQITRVKYYGKLDGFLGVETCQNSIFNDNDGAIWIGTIGGLCKFNPAELTQNPIPPILSFNDVRLFYESIVIDDSLSPILKGKQREAMTFSHNDNHLTFEFFGVNLKRPAGVLYQWKLEGFDEDWSPPSKEGSILYSNISPGKYTFMVRSSNEDGIWNEQPLVFEFEILAPFWKQTWFIILMILVVGAIIGASYLLSVRRIRRKAKEKQQQVELEMSLLELEQKALRLQMNPHFIFNALNSIQSLIGTGKEKEARYYLAKFSRLMRQILDNSRKSVITLEEEINTLENYLLVEQFCTNNRFEYSISVNEKLEADFIEIPPMLVQPFVENAIKHGMKGRDSENKGLISIQFEEVKHCLICTILDDGIGREKASQLKKESMETYHESASLKVTEERLEQLSNGHEHGSIHIDDLKDADGNARGTRIVLRIPIG